MDKRSPIELIEGFYLSHIVYQLHRGNIFSQLDRGSSLAEIAEINDYDEDLLTIVLEFVYQRTDLLTRDDDCGYALSCTDSDYQRIAFYLGKFIAAYGEAFVNLEDSLRAADLGSQFTDDSALANAFANIETSKPSPVAQVIGESGVESVLDLGCGPAKLLRDLCSVSTTFRGWGIDESTAMCRIARDLVQKADLSDRISIIHGNVREVDSLFPANLRIEVQALHGSSILNEFFRGGSSQVIGFLKQLKSLFPDRLFFVVDYYGKLNRTDTVIEPSYLHTMLHDVAQAVSGQGIPPTSLQDWISIYSSAQCEVMHAYEGQSDGLDWFIHVVRL